MSPSNSTSAPAKPAPPKVGDKAAEPAARKTTITGAFPARATHNGAEVRYVLGRKAQGGSEGLSAFRIADAYAPDLSKLPADGGVTLTQDAAGNVTKIGITASL